MSTSVEEIGRWFDEGVERGATHMIVVCDQYDHTDFPVYVQPGQDVTEVYEQERAQSLQQVMEVYCLSLDRADQLAERRAFHLDPPPSAALRVHG
ncbi:hypothetical protein ACIBCR_04765 [Micromonospora echinospora]|uniref:hypothetical protein n=1 Tax=Micromonospora echinospora TaxID=1877 RepID=UPI0037AD08FE